MKQARSRESSDSKPYLPRPDDDDGKQFNLLNRLGQALGAANLMGGKRDDVVARVRSELDVPGLSLWTLRHGAPAREAYDWFASAPANWEKLDASLAMEQIAEPMTRIIAADDDIPPVLSLPLIGYDDRTVGAMQIFGDGLVRFAEGPGASAFLRSLSGMFGQFAERRQLELGAALLREVHHRVKNNLHTVASVLRMQLRRLDQIDAAQALTESINRVQAIARVHEALSRPGMDQVDLLQLAREIFTGFDVDAKAHGDTVLLDTALATPLALIINELVQNAADHGKGDTSRTTLTIRVTLSKTMVRIVFADRGHGWPADFAVETNASLGLSIVAMLVEEELRGTLQLSNCEGAVAQIEFALP